MKITMKRNKKDYSENKINVYQICLVALAVGINIVGGQIALFMKLPVYLDSIGTILTGAVLGPWFGMLPNLISGIFMGMTVDIYSLYFAPVGMITGIMSGLVFRKLSVKKVKVLFAAVLITVPGTIVSIFAVQFLTDYLDRCISVFAVSVFVTMLGGELRQRLTGNVHNRAI